MEKWEEKLKQGNFHLSLVNFIFKKTNDGKTLMIMFSFQNNEKASSPSALGLEASQKVHAFYCAPRRERGRAFQKPKHLPSK